MKSPRIFEVMARDHRQAMITNSYPFEGPRRVKQLLINMDDCSN